VFPSAIEYSTSPEVEVQTRVAAQLEKEKFEIEVKMQSADSSAQGVPISRGLRRNDSRELQKARD
jgi:hypothetical protein